MYEILLLYILFFTLYKSIEFKKATIIISICILLSLIIMYIFNIPETWYKSTFAFVGGIVVAKYKENLKEWINSKFLIKIGGLLIALAISLGVGKFFNLGIFEVFIYNFSNILFILICLMILTKFSDFKNNIIFYIGNISFEIYLYHGLIIDLLLRFNVNERVGALLIILLTIIMASLIKQVDKKIISIFKEKDMTMNYKILN